jgi:hypothetical protein
MKGTTRRCEPKERIPDGWEVTHTSSHWQTDLSFRESYLKGILIPEIARRKKHFNLPETQWSLLKMDLHYSHKTQENLAFCEDNKIAVVFVPACCTDALQECDTVANKPFKSAMKSEFIAHTHSKMDTYLSNGGKLAEFRMKLTMGAMKPFMYDFVGKGISALRTPEMKVTISEAFIKDGRYMIARQTAASTIQAMPLLPDNFAIIADFEPENFDEEAEDSDSGSD